MFYFKRLAQLIFPVLIICLLLGGALGCGDADEEVPIDEEEEVVNGEEEAEGKEAVTKSGWELEVIAEDFSAAPNYGMVVDWQDNPHIVYEDPDTGNVEYAYRDEGGSWEEGTLAELGTEDEAFPAITKDDEGNLHAAFGDDGEIVYAFKENGEWEKEVVGEGDLSISEVGISIAAVGGNVHIMYPGFDSASAVVKGASRIDGEWKTEIAGEGQTQDRGSLTVDEAGNLHFCHLTFRPDHAIYYSTLQNGEWINEKVDEEVEVNFAPDVVISEKGEPQILYKKEVEHEEVDYDPNRIMEAVLENQEWITSIIEMAEMPFDEKIPPRGIQGAITSEGQFLMTYSHMESTRDLDWEEIVLLERVGDDWSETIIRTTEKTEEGVKRVFPPAFELDSQDKGHMLYSVRVEGSSALDENRLFSLKYINEE